MGLRRSWKLWVSWFTTYLCRFVSFKFSKLGSLEQIEGNYKEGLKLRFILQNKEKSFLLDIKLKRTTIINLLLKLLYRISVVVTFLEEFEHIFKVF